MTLPTHAITLWQPWAWLVVNGYKLVENRPPGFVHKSFRGPIWIHTGLHFDDERYDLAVRLLREIHPSVRMPPRTRFLDYPRGVIAGRVTFSDIIAPGKSGVPWHFEDEYGFVISDVVKLTRPVKCRGYQGIWTVPEETMGQLRTSA